MSSKHGLKTFLKRAKHRRPPSRPWSLAARLTLWYSCSAFVLVMIATWFLYLTLERNLDVEDDRFLANNVQVLRGLMRRQSGGDLATLKQIVRWESAFREYADICVRVLDDQGHLIVETTGLSSSLPPDLFPEPIDASENPRRGEDAFSLQRKPFRIMTARALVGPAGPKTVTLQVAVGDAAEENLLSKYRKHLWRVLGLAILASASIGYGMARRGIRPVLEISEATQRIRSTTLHERIDAAGLPAELSVLANTFNQMLTRLEESFTRLSQFSTDIAHELRTPVNNLRGEAEVALSKVRSMNEYRETLESCLEECTRLSRTIDRMLFLARTENPQTQINREEVNLEQELSVLRDFYEVAASEAGVLLAVKVGSGLHAWVDRTLFQRAVGNLIDNALTYTGRGGRITVSATGHNGSVRVAVADTGCGIPAEHLPHIFDRFYRADHARSTTRGGVGLGLAIVKGIATLHGGSVEIASEVGRGTRVALVLPETPHASSADLASSRS